jgi:hypothetical protein
MTALLAVDPAGEQEQEKGEGRRQPIHPGSLPEKGLRLKECENAQAGASQRPSRIFAQDGVRDAA